MTVDVVEGLKRCLDRNRSRYPHLGAVRESSISISHVEPEILTTAAVKSRPPSW